MYARGILFGKLKYELGDHAIVRCPETGLEADVEFKVKGWMGGTYNSIGGSIKDSKTGKALFELSGFWHGEMYIKDLATGKKELFFNAEVAKPTFPKARPLEEQGPRESQRLWDSTTRAIKKADHRNATDEKSKIEDEQREEAKERGEHEWEPKLFKAVSPASDEANLDWILRADVDQTAPAEQQIKQILAIAPILPRELQEAQSQPPQQSQQQARPQAQASALQQQPQQPQPVPQQQPQTSQPQGPAPLPRSGNDLIDFGQNDTNQAHPSQRSGTSGDAIAANMGDLSLNNSNKRSTGSGAYGRRGNPVKRLDSTAGTEETYIDAES